MRVSKPGIRVREIAVLLTLIAVAQPLIGADYPTPQEGDYQIENFEFASGEVLPELNLHYTTIGEPRRDASGTVRNAVLIMHGTTGSGDGFLSERFAGELFGPGQLLDGERYLHHPAPTPSATENRAARATASTWRFPSTPTTTWSARSIGLLTEHLGVDHLRLVMGTSMGGMHTWVWGYTYPDFMDALMPLASLPVEIAGRNRMLRKMIIDSIENDPAWNGGEYAEQPPGLITAMHPLIFMVSSPLQWQKEAPTREEAEAFLEARIQRYASHMDANDLIYQFDSSRDYDPSPHLEKIIAPLLAINSADDQVNPPELGILEREIQEGAPTDAPWCCRSPTRPGATGPTRSRRSGAPSSRSCWPSPNRPTDNPPAAIHAVNCSASSMIRSWVASARGRMPWSLPSCITATRSDKPRSSGISLEIRRMATPCSTSSPMSS